MDLAHFIGNREKLIFELKSVLKALSLACLCGFILIVILINMLTESQILQVIQKYKTDHFLFFSELNWINFKYVVKSHVLDPAISEEIKFRGPIWLISLYEFKLPKMRIDVTKLALWIFGGWLNYLWADSHTYAWPIFLAGIPLLWLTIKTKNILPPILCHFLMNFSIYVLVQLYF